jgi:hypothetical protein
VFDVTLRDRTDGIHPLAKETFRDLLSGDSFVLVVPDGRKETVTRIINEAGRDRILRVALGIVLSVLGWGGGFASTSKQPLRLGRLSDGSGVRKSR